MKREADIIPYSAWTSRINAGKRKRNRYMKRAAAAEETARINGPGPEKEEVMQTFTNILLIFLIICAVAASLSKNLLNTVLIFMSYSLVMSIIWILLESPDLAITEAAVGAGVTSVLFFVTLKKIRAIMKKEQDGGKGETGDEQESTEAGV